jgi:hypothetical protein
MEYRNVKFTWLFHYFAKLPTVHFLFFYFAKLPSPGQNELQAAHKLKFLWALQRLNAVSDLPKTWAPESHTAAIFSIFSTGCLRLLPPFSLLSLSSLFFPT